MPSAIFPEAKVEELIMNLTKEARNRFVREHLPYDMSLTTAALKIEVPHSTLRQWICRGVISHDKFDRLAAFLNVQPSELEAIGFRRTRNTRADLRGDFNLVPLLKNILAAEVQHLTLQQLSQLKTLQCRLFKNPMCPSVIKEVLENEFGKR